ncbi:MAG: putative membrane protein [Cenarchaeum symbiont of Oopsacas minuta]|nr:putative membrane protein [Cenarchaeum symbiont of Oopsacas minuta]
MTKIPVIGTILGVIIIAIGMYSLVTSFGLQDVIIDDAYPVGDRIQYSFNAPPDAVQTFEITGDSFNVLIEGPGISQNESYSDQTILNWSHSKEGRSIMVVSNTGSSDVTVSGVAVISTDPIHIAYHIMVIITGIVILGFSAGFSKRKPRGF